MKKVATGKTSDALRKLREKNAGKAKKQPAPAKPKQQPKKKVAAKPEFTDSGLLPQLKADAIRIDTEINEQCKALGNEYGRMLALDKKVEDFVTRELWKFLPVPFKNVTQWAKGKDDQLGSAAKVFSIIGRQKALPGTTAEQRSSMGRRKGSVAAAAGKQAAKKGKNLPPEIIDAAIDPNVTEPQLRQKVAEAGLAKEKPAEDKRADFDPLMFDPEKNTFPENPRNGGSGKAEGQPESAQQFSGVVKEAIDAFIAISHNPNVPDFEPDEALKGICAQWLRCECVESDYGDMTNRQAADEIGRTKKNGKAAHA